MSLAFAPAKARLCPEVAVKPALAVPRQINGAPPEGATPLMMPVRSKSPSAALKSVMVSVKATELKA